MFSVRYLTLRPSVQASQCGGGGLSDYLSQYSLVSQRRRDRRPDRRPERRPDRRPDRRPNRRPDRRPDRQLGGQWKEGGRRRHEIYH